MNSPSLRAPPVALSPQLIDLARVEVLRGPQPALYGESSMGGTIRYITADPDLEAFSGRAGAEIATTDGGSESYRTEGVLNLPLAEGVFAARIAGVYEEAGAGSTPRTARTQMMRPRLTCVQSSASNRPMRSASASWP